MAVNLRNSPVDKRRLKKADREQYKPKQAKQALAKVKAWRGQQAWEANRPVSSESKRGGTGGFTHGLSIQHQRLRDKGSDLARSKSLRQEGTYMPSLTQGMFNKGY